VKHLSGFIVFVVGFLVSGVIMHQTLYGKGGIFVWFVNDDAASGESFLERTTLEAAFGDAQLFEKDLPAEPLEKKDKKEEKGGHAAGKEEVDLDKVKKKSAEISLFNGKDLGKWKKTQFGGEGDVFVTEDGEMEFGFGAIMTGVNWAGEAPATSNYELTLDAMKLDGTDFFCALTFPVDESHATFVIGGWGGGIVGISSVDDLDASENETMNISGFEEERWYKVRVRVTDKKIEAWIDDEMMVDLVRKDRKISLRPGDIELCKPIGIASFITRAKYRNIAWKNLDKSK
jgi:hypothetical protein